MTAIHRAPPPEPEDDPIPEHIPPPEEDPAPHPDPVLASFPAPPAQMPIQGADSKKRGFRSELF